MDCSLGARMISNRTRGPSPRSKFVYCPAMIRNPLRFALFLLLITSLVGCAHRLKGPIYSADGPPWIAEGISNQNIEIEIRHRVVLIGDAGYFLANDPTLEALDDWATSVDSSSVLFLGDNIYNEGMTDDDREHGEQILGQQLAATETRKIVIPGNHDWGLFPKNHNAQAIRNQQAFVDEWPAGHAEFIPKEGCMGPVRRTLIEASGNRKAVVFIALDPTPWINERLREDCPTPQTQEEFLAALDALLALHNDDFVILGSHYPMLTGGPHGGLTYGFLGDLIVTPLGWIAGGLANTYETDYADWIARMQAVLRRNPPDVYVAGHDHSLQLLDAGDVAGMYLVSGAGAKERVSTVTNLPETFFAHAAPGFLVVDFGERDGSESIVVRVIEAGIPGPVFEMEIQSPGVADH
jgi:hypothetical protein